MSFALRLSYSLAVKIFTHKLCVHSFFHSCLNLLTAHAIMGYCNEEHNGLKRAQKG